MFSCFRASDDDDGSCFRRKLEATEMIDMDRRSKQGHRVSDPSSHGVLEPPRRVAHQSAGPIHQESPLAEPGLSFPSGRTTVSSSDNSTQKPTSSYWPPGQTRLTATQKSTRDLHRQYKRGSESRTATPTPTAFTGTASMTTASSFTSATSPSNVSQHHRRPSDLPDRSARSSKGMEEEEYVRGSGFHPFTTIPLSQPLRQRPSTSFGSQ